MTWVLIGIGSLFVGFMGKEGAMSVVRNRRIARLGLDHPPQQARYLIGCKELPRPTNLMIGRRGNEILLIEYGNGKLRATVSAPSTVAIMSRAEFEGSDRPMSDLPLDDGDVDFSDGMVTGIDFQGTKLALAKADSICVFGGIAVLHSDRAASLKLKELLEESVNQA